MRRVGRYRDDLASSRPEGRHYVRRSHQADLKVGTTYLVGPLHSADLQVGLRALTVRCDRS